jgi:hypothetical protein
MREDVTFNMDMITTLTKILQEKKKLGILSITDKSIKLDNNTPKHLQDKINSFFMKPKKNLNGDDGDSEMQDCTAEESKGYVNAGAGGSVVKKSEEAMMIEQEFEALLNRNILIRRGRNNRILAKLITKDVFQEDLTDDNVISPIGKRSKRH